jgi:hypothetical protein
MPGLRGKKVDTTDWTADDWRRTRRWNCAFLIGWIAFYAYGVGSLIHEAHWLMLAAFSAIALAGGILQVARLVRISISLKGR